MSLKKGPLPKPQNVVSQSITLGGVSFSNEGPTSAHSGNKSGKGLGPRKNGVTAS